MADIVSTLRGWSATPGSNLPAGTTTIGTNLDDNLRELQAVVRKYLASTASNMASATTVDLSTADGYYIQITGTTTITGLGTESAGIQYLLRFAGALTLTHNATSLILPGGASITTAAGDLALMISEGSGNWRCVHYSNANGIGFLQSGTGAVSRTAQAKMRDTFSVKDFGAVGDGTTDDTAAIQAAITAAITTGGKLYFPHGKYVTSAALIIDYSATTTDPVNGTFTRLHIEGAGPGSTMIWPSHSGKCIDYRGGTSDGASAFLEIRGIALRGPARAAGSIGLAVDNCAYWSLKDFDITLFEYGIDGTDILSGAISNGVIRLNQYGGRFAYSNFSRPNAIAIRDVIIATNYTYGLLTTGAACFLVDGGTVEGNGIGLSLANAAAWGIKCVDAGTEGAAGIVVRGTYFEGNNGNADVWIVQGSNTVHHSVHGSFVRFLSTQYVTYNVLFDRSGGGATSTAAVGGGFKALGTYVESAARPYLGGGISYFHEMPGNFYGSATALGREVFAPVAQPSIPIAFLPSAATFTGGSLYCSDLGGGGGIVVSDGAKWRRAEQGVQSVATDVDFTLTVLTFAEQIVHGGTLTANRTITLSTTNAYAGARFRVTRTGGGAFTLSVGGLKSLSLNQWADVTYDGAAWFLSAYGAL